MPDFLYSIRSDKDAKEPCLKILVNAERECKARETANAQAKLLYVAPEVEKIDNDGINKVENDEKYRIVGYTVLPY